jgi:Mrp family chromosome partitioning ATPase
MQTLERWSSGPTVIGSLWRFRYVVGAISILGAALGYTLAQFEEPVYESSTRMFVTTPASAAVFQQRGALDLERHVLQQAQRLRSPTVLEGAATLLDDGSTGAGIARQLSVDSDLDLATLTVTVKDQSPRRAADVANAVAEAYQDDVRASHQGRVDRASEELERSAAQIDAQLEELLAATAADPEDPGLGGQQAASQAGVLTQRLLEIDALVQQLQVDARVFDAGVEFREPATPPAETVAPRPLRSAAGGLLLAAMAGTAFAYWRAGRDNRIENRDAPAAILDAPLLGTLPTYKPAEQVTLAQRTALEPRTAEAYRFVYSSLMSIMRPQGASSIMVSSGGPGAGKTETALQLAATAARRGQRVLLIDADLRMRGITGALHAEHAPGLVNLAAVDGRRSHEDVIRRYPLDREHGLDVLTTGSTSGHGEYQLSDIWFGTLFKQLVADYDLTIIDSPPLLAVADAAIIAEHADSIVLIIREGADIGELERARQRLGFVQQGRDPREPLLAGYVYLTPKALDNSHLDYGLVRSGWKPGAARADVSTGDARPQTVRRISSAAREPDHR